ncbi:hypothetical protein I1A59_04045 [Streptococcus mitis]|nr:hypothetical protein [Streptococcus sp. NLN76]
MTLEKSYDIFRNIIKDSVDFHGNNDMLSYLLDKAWQFEKHHRSRNFIVENSNTNDIVGFFSLSLKVIDISNLEKSIKKRLILKGKSPNNIDIIPVLLIGQFGKNTKINQITGTELFQEVLKKIELFRSIVGTQIVFLDSLNHPKVISFYKKFGFVTYSDLITDDQNITYQPMALNMSSL